MPILRTSWLPLRLSRWARYERLYTCVRVFTLDTSLYNSTKNNNATVSDYMYTFLKYAHISSFCPSTGPLHLMFGFASEFLHVLQAHSCLSSNPRSRARGNDAGVVGGDKWNSLGRAGWVDFLVGSDPRGLSISLLLTVDKIKQKLEIKK